MGDLQTTGWTSVKMELFGAKVENHLNLKRSINKNI